jgi:dihydrofolate synthase/folylpolyglutamate synthase
LRTTRALRMLRAALRNSPMTLPDTLADWLDYQQRQHIQPIALGLQRVRAVWQALGAPPPARCVISVGGTNGKGSTVAFLEAMLRARGLHVGAYTSPHLLRYNERVRIDARAANDAALCAAFVRIEQARGVTPLTYFEYGTLAALLLFADDARLDVALLEVGLGGRLDAVNIIDADAAIVTTIGIDHTEYLGADRDSIGREKAGIARAGRPLILGSRDVPDGLLRAAMSVGATVLRLGLDFEIVAQVDAWRWSALARAAHALLDAEPTAAINVPELPLAGPHQPDNAAAALAALWVLRQRLGWAPQDYARGIAAVRLPGRLQALGGTPELIVDVAHNPQAAAELAAWLDTQPREPTRAVFSALTDKDIAGIGAALGTRIAHWHVCGIHDAGTRGLDAAGVAARLRVALPRAAISLHADVHAALAAARAARPMPRRVLAFGSFHIAGAVLNQLPPQA